MDFHIPSPPSTITTVLSYLPIHPTNKHGARCFTEPCESKPQSSQPFTLKYSCMVPANS